MITKEPVLLKRGDNYYLDRLHTSALKMVMVFIESIIKSGIVEGGVAYNGKNMVTFDKDTLPLLKVEDDKTSVSCGRVGQVFSSRFIDSTVVNFDDDKGITVYQERYDDFPDILLSVKCFPEFNQTLMNFKCILDMKLEPTLE